MGTCRKWKLYLFNKYIQILCYYLKKKVLLLVIKFAIINNYLVIKIAVKMYQDSNNYVILKVYEKNCCNNIKVIAIAYAKCCNKI